MPKPTPHDAEAASLDPVYVNTRREALVIVALFIVFMTWSITVCYSFGYTLPTDDQPLSTTMGMPTWVFWGVFVPWMAVDVVAVWFCFAFMKDDDLGEDADEVGEAVKGADHV